ncbi:MAG: BTAD domain-containing putative transcriptional regulator, partial [Methyloligellaceae bacterium]
MAALEIHLLGRFEVLHDGTPVADFRTQKTRALLVYLALHAGTPLSRAALAGIFWPEQSATGAAHNLRQALTFLRRAIRNRPETPPPPDATLLTTRSTATFSLTGEYWLDVTSFKRRLVVGLAEGGGSPSLTPDQVNALAEAVRLYRGPLLTGFFVDGAPEFETWLLTERERLQAGALAALDRLAEFHLVRSEYPRARDLLLQALALDPWHETAHRGLMRALALAGHPNAALAQYEKCRQVLTEGLGVEPLEATQALYRQILTGEAGLQPAPLAAVKASRYAHA